MLRKLIKVNNMIHVSTPALVEYPNAFRIITVNDQNNKISVNFKFMETDLKNIQQESREKSHSPSLSYGQPKDRNSTIIFDKSF